MLSTPSSSRLRASLLSSVLGLLAVTACGPSDRPGTDNDDTDTNDDSTCVPNGDFETCGGGVDDDCDGAIDCDDPDCAEADLCQGGGNGCDFETPTASLYLPDGVGCADSSPTGSNASTGCETQTSPLNFQGFPAGATLTDVNDLVSVCVTAEHSYIPDVQFELLCPNGSMAELIAFQGQENYGYIGEPDESDEADAPGVGWQYCWTMNAANPPILDYIADHTDFLDPNYDPNWTTVPAGDYQPSGDFANFVGCPLNGDWVFSAQDRWGIDNGFIFSWQINFSPDLADDCQID